MQPANFLYMNKQRNTQNKEGNRKINSSDGRVVRASAFGAVDLGLIPSRVKPMTLKLVFTATLQDLDIRAQKMGSITALRVSILQVGVTVDRKSKAHFVIYQIS